MQVLNTLVTEHIDDIEQQQSIVKDIKVIYNIEYLYKAQPQIKPKMETIILY